MNQSESAGVLHSTAEAEIGTFMRKLNSGSALVLLCGAFVAMNASAVQPPFTLLHSLFDPSTNGQAAALHGFPVAADGNLVAVASINAGIVDIHDRATGRVRYSLSNPSPTYSDQFGISLAIQGSRVVVGADEVDTGAINAGVVYVYDLVSATPLEPYLTLTNPEPAAYENFGRSVSISGTRVIIGTPQENTGTNRSGSAYIYELESVNPAVPEITLHNPEPSYIGNFGWSVAISGSLVVVGALNDDTGAARAGSAYVYDLSRTIPSEPILTLNNPTPGVDDYFGSSVAISGNRLVIGAFGDSEAAPDAGTAYVYDLTRGDPSVPCATLMQPRTGAFARGRFGISVGISGNWVVVGADEDSTSAHFSGIAYVYDLASATPQFPVLILTNPTPVFNDHFGSSVAISGSGIIVGAPNDDIFGSDSGSAYLYDLVSATPRVPAWTLRSSLPARFDGFGRSVAISGTHLVVGAPWDASGAQNSGRAYLYSLTNTTTSMPVLWLTNPAPAELSNFGSAVAISETYVVVGAPGAAYVGGCAYVFNLTNATPATSAVWLGFPCHGWWESFGSSVAISGSLIVVGAPANPSATEFPGSVAGTAYVYDMESAEPASSTIILTNPTPANLEYFGNAVAISGTRVVIGAYMDYTSGISAGSAYVYDLSQTLPSVPVLTLTNPSPNYEAAFGSAVAISGTRVVVGVPGDDTGATDSGVVYIYDLATATPGKPVITLINPSPVRSSQFGFAVAVSGTRVIVGACQDNSDAAYTGIAYVYDLANRNPSIPEATLRNPRGVEFDLFGITVAIDGVTTAVGAPFDSTGGLHRGATYLFGLSPALTFVRSSPGLARLSWSPTTSPGLVLQYSDTLAPANWLNAQSGAMNPVTIALTNAARFYRLVQP